MEIPEGVPIGKLQIIPPEPEFLKIACLYLEKYELLSDEDKQLYRRLLVGISNPPMFIRDDKIDWESSKVPRI